jgi:hypothetical protein
MPIGSMKKAKNFTKIQKEQSLCFTPFADY